MEIAQEQGKLNIEDKVSNYLDRGWSRSSPENESKIPIHHFPTMISGLDDYLVYTDDAGTDFFIIPLYLTNYFQLYKKPRINL